MKKLIFLFTIISFGLWSCQKAADPNIAEAEIPQKYNPTEYTTFDIPGSDLKRVEKRDTSGTLLETGFLDGNVRTGIWVTFYPTTGMPAKTAALVDGKYNGPYFEYTLRGQVELIANYKDNKLHGSWAKYFFSRPEIIANYNEGKLDGVYRKYFPNKTDAIQEEVNYINGVMDGKYRYFNDKGQLTLEYDYKNGKKVGGGIVNQ